MAQAEAEAKKEEEGRKEGHEEDPRRGYPLAQIPRPTPSARYTFGHAETIGTRQTMVPLGPPPTPSPHPHALPRRMPS